MSEEPNSASDEDSIICLECGGIVVEHAPPPSGVEACTCHHVDAHFDRARAHELSSAKSISCPSCGGSLKLGARSRLGSELAFGREVLSALASLWS